MKFTSVINGDSGTIRCVDADAYCGHLQSKFSANGHEVECRVVAGNQIDEELGRAASENGVDGILAAGGDGTISCAGGHAWRSGKMLGVIPAGTMNLYARSLKIPLDIWTAAEALAAGDPGQSDIVVANGRSFLHQYSVGFHPRMIRSRSQYHYCNRWGKLRASMLSALDTVRRPPVFPVRIDCDGDIEEREISALSVSNNPYGERHIPYADVVSTGMMGVYVSGPLDLAASARLLSDMMFGSWRGNPDIEERTARSVKLHFPKHRRFSNAVIDGELVKLPRDVEFTIHHNELSVLLPAASHVQAGPASISAAN